MVPDTATAPMGTSMAKPSVPPPSSAMPPLMPSVQPVPVVVPQPNEKEVDKQKDDSAPAGPPDPKKEEVWPAPAAVPAFVPAPAPAFVPAPAPEQVVQPAPTTAPEAAVKKDEAKEVKKEDEPAPVNKENGQPSNGDAGIKTEKSSNGEARRNEGKAKGGLQLLASLALPVSKGPIPHPAGNGSVMPPYPVPVMGGMPPFPVAGSGMPPLMVPPAAMVKKQESTSTMPPLHAPGAIPPPGTIPPLLDPKNPNAAAIAIIQNDNKNKKKKSRMEEMDPKDKIFVEKVGEVDVLCGRGGKSNHHPGNKRYRQVVSEMKRTYRSTGAKTAKTDLSRAIVEHVLAYGGRFIKRDEGTGQYFLLTKAQARRKTSQALRETKELKWTM